MEQFNLIKSKANKIATLKDGDIFETTNYSGEKLEIITSEVIYANYG